MDIEFSNTHTHLVTQLLSLPPPLSLTPSQVMDIDTTQYQLLYSLYSWRRSQALTRGGSGSETSTRERRSQALTRGGSGSETSTRVALFPGPHTWRVWFGD